MILWLSWLSEDSLPLCPGASPLLPPPLQYAVAQLPDAKGMFPENHPHFMGTYWGAVSWPAVAEVVESADLVLTVGCVWTDYSTVGYSLLLKPEKVWKVWEVWVVWGQSMDSVLTVGCVWTDYSTVGYSLLLRPEKVWEV